MSDHDHRWRRRAVLVRHEQPAGRCGHADGREVARRDGLPAHALGAPADGERGPRARRDLDGLEGAGARRDVPDVRPRDVALVARLVAHRPDAHEAVRVRKGRRLQQHRAGDRDNEDRASRPERDAEHRGEREAQRAAQAAQRVTEIGEEGVHDPRILVSLQRTVGHARGHAANRAEIVRVV
jgi:hypothetical protein